MRAYSFVSPKASVRVRSIRSWAFPRRARPERWARLARRVRPEQRVPLASQRRPAAVWQPAAWRPAAAGSSGRWAARRPAAEAFSARWSAGGGCGGVRVPRRRGRRDRRGRRRSRIRRLRAHRSLAGAINNRHRGAEDGGSVVRREGRAVARAVADAVSDRESRVGAIAIAVHAGGAAIASWSVSSGEAPQLWRFRPQRPNRP